MSNDLEKQVEEIVKVMTIEVIESIGNNVVPDDCQESRPLIVALARMLRVALDQNAFMKEITEQLRAMSGAPPTAH